MALITTQYFKDLVDSETKKLNQLCEQWVHIMDDESDITEEGFGQIRSTIGKTHLLIDQRFKQFNGLIDDCHLKRGPKETKVEDLQGFWDMIYFQIEDLIHGFERLNQLKDNQWRELEIKPKPIERQKSAKVLPKLKTTKPIVRSKIRDQIQNLKNTKSEALVAKNESFGEKENQKIEICIKSEKVLNVSKNDSNLKSIESMSEMKNVFKRTPLLNAIKK